MRIPPWLSRAAELLDGPADAQAASRRERLAVRILAAAVVIYVAAALYLTRGGTSYLDSLIWLVHGAKGFSPAALLEPYNGHLIGLTRLLYAVGVRVSGPDQLVFELFQILSVAASACLLFVLLRRRIDSLIALVPTVLFLFLGSTTVLLEPNVAVFAQSTALGLGALIAVGRRDRLGDVLAFVLVLGGVLAFSLGIPFALGAGALIAARDDRFRRAWIVVIPLLLYAGWAIWAQRFDGALERGPDTGSLSNLLLAPNFAADSLAAALAAALGLGRDLVGTSTSGMIDLGWGRPLAILLVGFIGFRAARGRLTAMGVAAVVVLASYWVLGALNVGGLRLPETERYVFPAVALCFLVIAEAAPAGFVVTRRISLAAIAVLCLALPGNLFALRVNGAGIREISAQSKALLATVELERDNVDPEVPVGSSPVAAGDYLAFADRFGSAGIAPAELPAQPEPIREAADRNLVRILDIRPAAAAGTGHSDCSPLGGGGPSQVELPPGGAVLSAQARVRIGLRRLADSPQSSYVFGPDPMALRIPTDSLAAAWVVSVADGDGPVEVCAS